MAVIQEAFSECFEILSLSLVITYKVQVFDKSTARDLSRKIESLRRVTYMAFFRLIFGELVCMLGIERYDNVNYTDVSSNHETDYTE